MPDEIVSVVTWLVIHTDRVEQASPAGEIGPDGLTVRPYNPWKFERVAAVIDRYRVTRLVV